MRHARWSLPLFLLLAGLMCAQSDKRARYQQMLENDYVRVFNLELGPGYHAPAFQNLHDVIWVALDDNSLTLVPVDGERSRVQFKPGDARLFRSYKVREFFNDSGAPFRGVVVELKQRGLTSEGCGCLGDIERAVCGCGQAEHMPPLWAVGIGSITLAGSTLAPGQSFTSASHRNDSLLIAITPLQIEDTHGDDPVDVRLQPGEVQWLKEGNHQFKNMGSGTARFVTIEF